MDDETQQAVLFPLSIHIENVISNFIFFFLFTFCFLPKTEKKLPKNFVAQLIDSTL